MRYSANLNIIIKALEKAASRASRDFIELENLQTNPASAARFANSCYNKAKQIIAEDLTNIRPDYNMIFADGEKYVASQNAEYSYVIFPIDGINNLVRSNPCFTIAIALEHINAAGQKEPIALAINNIANNEIYYCEKGFGAYVNNRRLRVSKRSLNDGILVCSEDIKNESKNISNRNYGCKTLELAYLASARIDAALLPKQDLIKPFTLLVREAGGKVVENEKLIIASNGLFELVV